MKLMTLIMYVPNNQLFYDSDDHILNSNNYILRFPYYDPNVIRDGNNSDNPSSSVNQNQKYIIDEKTNLFKLSIL